MRSEMVMCWNGPDRSRHRWQRRGVRGLTLTLPAVLAAVFVGRSGSAADWPQFRGPSGLGYTAETNLPLTWNAKTGEGIAWKAPLPKSDNAYSSPVVWGDHVFVTYALNQPLEHHLRCFARKDGSVRWDTAVAPGPWLLKDLRGGYGAPTPCTDGTHVFAVF